MKYSILFLLMTVLTTVGCKKDDDSGGGGSASEGTIKATVDGASFESLKIATFATVTNNFIQIQGNTGGTNAKAIVFNIFGYDGVGTYEFNGSSLVLNTASYTEVTVDLSNPLNSKTEAWNAPYETGVSGEINFSEATDTKVVGTFNFKAKNSEDESVINITSGSFNVNIQ